jgi:hypothetical protein
MQGTGSASAASALQNNTKAQLVIRPLDLKLHFLHFNLAYLKAALNEDY